MVVADHLMQQRAVLLPNFTQVFGGMWGSLTGAIDLILEVVVIALFISPLGGSFIWSSYLHAYMSYKCEGKKFDTTLF